ncbi:MAG: SDR family NAD(P)-dependent oxidoreductase [Actinomycetes bacterium]
MREQTSEPGVALVAGASRGLGLLIAERLVREGFSVAICARSEAELERARARLEDEAAGRTGVVAVPCDLTQRREIDDLVREVSERLGPVDVLVYVAGVIQVGPEQDMTDHHFEVAVDTMLWGPVRLARAVLPGMRERGYGRIAVVTSIGGRLSVPHLLPYCVAKFGAVGFTEGLRAELAGTGVKVTTIVPGLMRTGSHLRAHFTGKQEQEYAWFALGASAPLVAMDADRAADRIVAGVRAGRREVVLTPLAQVAMRFHGIAPATTTALMELMARLLPSSPPPSDTDATRTVEGEVADEALGSRMLRGLTVLGRRAAQRNNEL